MAWGVAASQNLVDMDLSDASKCRDLVLAFNKDRQLSMKVIPGPASGVRSFDLFTVIASLMTFVVSVTGMSLHRAPHAAELFITWLAQRVIILQLCGKCAV